MVDILKGTRPFYDDRHFPQGFNRSGDFTVPEAKLLTDYGQRLRLLSDGKATAENEAESQFIQVANGKAVAMTAIEKVWLKYLKVSSPHKFVSIYGAYNSEVETDTETISDGEI